MAGLGAEFGGGEETEGAQAVVEGDDDETFAGEGLAVVAGARAGADAEAAAVDPDQDRAALLGGGCTGPDVEVQAVLAHREVDAGDLAVGGLRAHRAEGPGRAHAGPGRRGLGRAPARLPHRGRRVGDAAEHGERVVAARYALHQPCFGFHWVAHEDPFSCAASGRSVGGVGWAVAG